MKKFIFVFIFLLIIIVFFNLNSYSVIREKCSESDVLATDKITNNYVKYVICARGYSKPAFNSEDYSKDYVSGYVTYDQKGLIIDTKQLETSSDLSKMFHPHLSFKEASMYSTGVSQYSFGLDIENISSSGYLFNFDNNLNFKKNRDVSFSEIKAYLGHNIFYLDDKIFYKENISTGEKVKIKDLNELKTDYVHSNIYGMRPLVLDNKLMFYFNIETPAGSDEYYVLYSDTGLLNKLSYNEFHHNESDNKDIYPIKIKYLITKKLASDYNLKYYDSINVGFYKFLLFLEK